MGGFLKLNLGSEGRKGKREMKQGEGGCIYLSEREKGERREEKEWWWRWSG